MLMNIKQPESSESCSKLAAPSPGRRDRSSASVMAARSQWQSEENYFSFIYRCDNY